MSTLDIEDLLRRTYADVAARTVAAPPGDATLVALTGGRAGPRRWAMLAAAAAVVALVAGGAALLGRDGPAGPADVDPATLVHVLPGALPGPGNGLITGDSSTLPLVRVESTSERDVLEYASDEQRFVIEVARGAAATSVEGGDRSIGGASAVLDEERRVLTWNPRTGMQVTVRFEGGDIERLLRLADALIYVDATAWESATANAGFGPWQIKDETAGVVAEFRLSTSDPVTVRIRGWLQSGYEIVFPRSFGSVGISVDALDAPCRASGSMIDDGPGNRVAVFTAATGPVTVLDERGDAVAVADAEVRIPGTDLFMEVVEVDAERAEGMTWSCVGE